MIQIVANNNRRSILAGVALLLLVWITGLSTSSSSAFVGFGGYVSEKLLGNSNNVLYLGDEASELVVLGSCPTVSTGTATSTSIGGTISATLRGNLSNLNGMPRADVWFVWGYSPSAMVYSTTLSTVTTTGEQTATISPDVGDTVYYQFRSSTDGTSAGATRSFVAGGGHGASHWMINTLLPIIVAGVVLVSVFLLTSNPIAAFLVAVLGVVGYYVILAIASIL